ncbi:DoxX family protein [Streptomyces sp. NBC_01262]|uniref:DoxX family protein n=1 Tax=Streptomyces sp. NBC_01262 TaxID=2903803 RepID=UPI002E2FF9A9|nr:DoxX family protein [Streptomyces sp. NBC_01262]
MNAALWTVQIVLAVVFLASGAMKVSQPKDRLIASGQTGVAPFPAPVIKLTASAEIAAAAGLILPQATGIAPVLTPIAAVGLAVVMVGAMISHSTLLRADLAAGRGPKEALGVATTLVLLALCVFVAAGRF